MKYIVVKILLDDSKSVEFFDTLEGAKMFAEQFRENKFLKCVVIYEATEY